MKLKYLILLSFLTLSLNADLPHVNLDFSELKGLPELNQKLSQVSKIYERPVNIFKTEAEVLSFHNDYINTHPDIHKITNLIGKDVKHNISILNNNNYEVKYYLENEQLRFFYDIAPHSSSKAIYLSKLIIMLEQKSLPVWIQTTSFLYKNSDLDTFARPLESEEYFYDGTIKKIKYEYSDKNDRVNLYQTLNYDETYRIQPDVLLAYEEHKAKINTQKLISSHVQSWLLQLKEEYRNSDFEMTISHEKFTFNEAKQHCNALSVEKSLTWDLPSKKDLLTLSTDIPIKQTNGHIVFIRSEYIDKLPLAKENEELTFWTSELMLVDEYELGNVVPFSYSLDAIENDPIDLASDKNTKHYVICKKVK